MTSKEALEIIGNINLGSNPYCHFEEDLLKNCLKNEYDIIKKDLEVLECFKKIDKKELKDFIETQIRYALNENTWLSACNCDLGKEKPTKHLIKIKEWLESE